MKPKQEREPAETPADPAPPTEKGEAKAPEAGAPKPKYVFKIAPADPKNAMTLLRYNVKMLHGAFAVEKTEGGEMIVVERSPLLGAGIRVRPIAPRGTEAPEAEEPGDGG